MNISKNSDVLSSKVYKADSGYSLEQNPQIKAQQSKIADDAGMSASNTQGQAKWASSVPSKKGNKPQ